MEDVRGLWISRLLLLRGTGVISLIAFLVALNQFRPLLGEHGLLPVPLFVKQLPFQETPSLFYLWPKNAAFLLASWTGILLSCVVITGVSERFGSWGMFAIWAAIYIIYLSFVNVGQTFYGFGWESIFLEACFFAMFLGDGRTVTHPIPIYLFRWLLFRVMLGAGLIKLRGDPCWRDLTCLNYFYETQPMPNPLSWYLHWAPEWVRKSGVGFNHFAELIVPFALFLPQPFAGIAGVLSILFQLTIIIGGNLSWLNWLTIVLAFSTIDGQFLAFVLKWVPVHFRSPEFHAVEPAFYWMNVGVAALVAVMSIPVVINMFSPGQAMNASFNPFHLVSTYGAFGSITRPRYEIVVQGTSDEVITPSTRWLEYEFKGKPTDVSRCPPQVAPYHLRLDWLMWFAAMDDYRNYPWFFHFMAKLLENDRDTLSLIKTNPFPNQPPKWVKAELFEYHFTTPDQRRQSGNWWVRTYTRQYLAAISLNGTNLKSILRDQGWRD
jgi:hypothetical protein